jgi:hypothetical protein
MVQCGTLAAGGCFRTPRLRATRAAVAHVVLRFQSVTQNTRQWWSLWIWRRWRQHLHDLVQFHVRLE